MNEMTKPEQMTFELTVVEAERLEVIAREIEGIQAQAIIQIGAKLVEAQAVFKHRRDVHGFGGWVDSRLSFKQATAYRMIAVHQKFGAESVSLGDTFEKHALYALAGPGVPQEARDEALTRAEAGEHITKADAEEMVAKAVAASVAEAIAEAEANQQEAIEAAIAEATEELADDKEALEAEIKKIRAEARKKTDLPKLVDTACRLLKIKKLTGLQYHHLAQLLGQAISVNGTRYLPLSSEQIKENEDRMRVASTVSEAVGVLAGAPPPAALLAVCYPVQRLRIAQRMDAVIAWATECREAVKAWEGEEV